MNLPIFTTDTETYLIRPGVGAPPMVCTQFQVDNNPPEIIHARDPALRRIWEWALTSCRVVGHVLAYDMAVVCAWCPDLIPLVFQAYGQDRATCTQIRQKLADIARGIFEGDGHRRWGYHLDECTFRSTEHWPQPVILDKADPWRLKYGTLFHLPVDQWPEDARRYALGDPWAAKVCYDAQEAAIQPAHLLDQYAQSRAAFWLRLMECRGIRTDRVQVERFHAATLEEARKDRAIAEAAGLVRPTGVRNMKAAMARMVQVMMALDEPIPLTETGEKTQAAMAKERGGLAPSPLEIWQTHQDYIKLDEDACLASGDDILQAFQRYGSEKTTLGRVERLYYGIDLPLQASFQSIVETGRTSCRMGDVEAGVSPPSWGFQLQNLPRKEGMRECFIPRSGPLTKPRLTQEQIQALLAQGPLARKAA